MTDNDTTWVNSYAAANPASPEDVLLYALNLKGHDNFESREYAASNYNATSKVLLYALSLKGLDDKLTRLYAASNTGDGVTEEVLLRAVELKGSANTAVRAAALDHKKATVAVVTRCLDVPELRKLAQFKLESTPEYFLDLKAEDKALIVRETTNMDIVELALKLTGGGDAIQHVKEQAAANEHNTPAVLRLALSLPGKANLFVRAYALSNRNADASVYAAALRIPEMKHNAAVLLKSKLQSKAISSGTQKFTKGDRVIARMGKSSFHTGSVLEVGPRVKVVFDDGEKSSFGLTTTSLKKIELKRKFKTALTLDQAKKVVQAKPRSVPTLEQTMKHISSVLRKGDEKAKIEVIRRTEVNDEQLATALQDSSKAVKLAARANPKLSSAHLYTALEDDDKEVRVVALTHPNATSEHFKFSFNQKDNK